MKILLKKTGKTATAIIMLVASAFTIGCDCKEKEDDGLPITTYVRLMINDESYKVESRAIFAQNWLTIGCLEDSSILFYKTCNATDTTKNIPQTLSVGFKIFPNEQLVENVQYEFHIRQGLECTEDLENDQLYFKGGENYCHLGEDIYSQCYGTGYVEFTDLNVSRGRVRGNIHFEIPPNDSNDIKTAIMVEGDFLLAMSYEY